MGVDNIDTGVRPPEDRRVVEQRAILNLAAKQAVDHAASRGTLDGIVAELRQGAKTGDLMQFTPKLGLSTPGAPFEASHTDLMAQHLSTLISTGDRAQLEQFFDLINKLDPIDVPVEWTGSNGLPLTRGELSQAGLPKLVRRSTNLLPNSRVEVINMGQEAMSLMQQFHADNPAEYKYKTPAGDITRGQMGAILSGKSQGADGIPLRPMYQANGTPMLFVRDNSGTQINALKLDPGEYLRIRKRELGERV